MRKRKTGGRSEEGGRGKRETTCEEWLIRLTAGQRICLHPHRQRKMKKREGTVPIF